MGSSGVVEGTEETRRAEGGASGGAKSHQPIVGGVPRGSVRNDGVGLEGLPQDLVRLFEGFDMAQGQGLHDDVPDGADVGRRDDRLGDPCASFSASSSAWICAAFAVK